jgi:hypothetical protein
MGQKSVSTNHFLTFPNETSGIRGNGKEVAGNDRKQREFAGNSGNSALTISNFLTFPCISSGIIGKFSFKFLS